jgi:hypothetical protein
MWSSLAQGAGCFEEGVNGTLPHCEFIDACLPQGISVAPFNSVTGLSQVMYIYMMVHVCVSL